MSTRGEKWAARWEKWAVGIFYVFGILLVIAKFGNALDHDWQGVIGFSSYLIPEAIGSDMVGFVVWAVIISAAVHFLKSGKKPGGIK